MKKLLLLLSIAAPLIWTMLFAFAAMRAWLTYSKTGYVDFNLIAMASIGLIAAVVFQFGSLQPKNRPARHP